MRTMWKYQLKSNEIKIKLPSYKPIPRHVKFQQDVYGDGLYVWIEIPDTKETEREFTYTFYTVCTGDMIPADTCYVGSAQEPITKEIIHVYMR